MLSVFLSSSVNVFEIFPFKIKSVFLLFLHNKREGVGGREGVRGNRKTVFHDSSHV